jgi:hypothetical protein
MLSRVSSRAAEHIDLAFSISLRRAERELRSDKLPARNQIRRRPDYFNNTVQVNRASPVLAGQLHHLLSGYISRSLGGLLIAVR